VELQQLWPHVPSKKLVANGDERWLFHLQVGDVEAHLPHLVQHILVLGIVHVELLGLLDHGLHILVVIHIQVLEELLLLDPSS